MHVGERHLRETAALLGAFCLIAWGCYPRVDSVGSIVARQNEELRTYDYAGPQSLAPFGAPVEPADVASLLPEETLTLPDARALAVRGNPDVHAAYARLHAARGRIEEALARYYPVVTMTHNSARTFHTPETRNRLAALLQAPVVPDDPIETDNPALTAILNVLRRPLTQTSSGSPNTSAFSEHSTAFTVVWVAFDGFVRDARLLAAKHVERASIASVRDVQRLIIQAVDAAYYRVQLAEDQVRIARADEAFSLEQLEETQKLRKANRASESAVNNFRVRYLAAHANVTTALGRRELGRVLLAELMGVPSGMLPETLQLPELGAETDAEMALPDVDAWVARALNQRPDVDQLASLMSGERESVRAAEATFNPTVSLSASWGFDRASSVQYGRDDQSSAAALEFRWELYTGGARDAAVSIAEAGLTEARANLNRALLSVQSDVRSAVISITNAQEQIRLQRENLSTAVENRRIVRAGYYAGREPLTRLNEAQRDVINADADLSLARIRLRQAWSELRAAASDYPVRLPEDAPDLPTDDGG